MILIERGAPKTLKLAKRMAAENNSPNSSYILAKSELFKQGV
jgi:hypothetical protein